MLHYGVRTIRDLHIMDLFVCALFDLLVKVYSYFKIVKIYPKYFLCVL